MSKGKKLRIFLAVTPIIAAVLFVLVLLVDNPIVAATAALAYLIASYFIADMTIQTNINDKFVNRFKSLENRITELEENQTAIAKYNKRGKPHLIQSPGVETKEVKVVTTPQEEQEAIKHGEHYMMESQRYKRKTDLNETDEQFQTRVRMEMNSVMPAKPEDLEE